MAHWERIVDDINNCLVHCNNDWCQAVIRLWTGEHVYRIVNPICRKDDISDAELTALKPFLKMLWTALRSLPPQYSFKGSKTQLLFRGEQGTIKDAETIFENAGNIFHTAAFTATNKNPNGLTGIPGMMTKSIRTVYVIDNGEGFMIKDFSQFSKSED
eukprot:PhF_6_TR23258/c0_g1_i3/m.32684